MVNQQASSQRFPAKMIHRYRQCCICWKRGVRIEYCRCIWSNNWNFNVFPTHISTWFVNYRKFNLKQMSIMQYLRQIKRNSRFLHLFYNLFALPNFFYCFSTITNGEGKNFTIHTPHICYMINKKKYWDMLHYARRVIKFLLQSKYACVLCLSQGFV